MEMEGCATTFLADFWEVKVSSQLNALFKNDGAQCVVGKLLGCVYVSALYFGICGPGYWYKENVYQTNVNILKSEGC